MEVDPCLASKKKRYDALNLVLDPSFENIMHAPLSNGLYRCNYAQVKASVIVQLSLTVVVIPARSAIDRRQVSVSVQVNRLPVTVLLGKLTVALVVSMLFAT